MRVFLSCAAAAIVLFGAAPVANADYKLPLEGVFSSITNFFVTEPSRPSSTSLSVDEVPSPMASEIDKVYFQGRLDGLFCKRYVKERTFKDCSTCCAKQYRDIIGHDGLAAYPTDLKNYYISTCNKNCASR